jgi:hypothetical protein
MIQKFQKFYANRCAPNQSLYVDLLEEKLKFSVEIPRVEIQKATAIYAPKSTYYMLLATMY